VTLHKDPRKDEGVVASNFKIITQRNSDTLHIKLLGDFDGTSAFELLDALKRNCLGARRAIIHTSNLKDIYPFGKNVFQNRFSEVSKHFAQILFTGENASQVSPDKGACL
jgi:hypothetical protein